MQLRNYIISTSFKLAQQSCLLLDIGCANPKNRALSLMHKTSARTGPCTTCAGNRYVCRTQSEKTFLRLRNFEVWPCCVCTTHRGAYMNVTTPLARNLVQFVVLIFYVERAGVGNVHNFNEQLYSSSFEIESLLALSGKHYRLFKVFQSFLADG